jgi:quinoprotein glucose dehydrogenase
VLALLRTGRNAMPPAPPLTGQQQHDLLDFLMRRHQPLAPRSPSLNHPGDEFAGSGTFLNDQDGYPGCKPPWGQLNCIDLNTGKMLWRVTLGEYPELTKLGLPATGTENFGGPTVTAGGLVFCSGTRDAKIRAFDKDTGEELWSAKLPYGGFAPPSIYEVAGREYVVIAAAGGGVPGLKAGSLPTGDAYVAFALPTGKSR